eukprot:16438866-Heterocapsa_arctica.AAC.1
MDRHSIVDKPIEDFSNSLVAFLRGLPENVLKQTSVVGHARRLESMVLPNITLRGQIVDFVVELVACPNPPDTVKEA